MSELNFLDIPIEIPGQQRQIIGRISETVELTVEFLIYPTKEQICDKTECYWNFPSARNNDIKYSNWGTKSKNNFYNYSDLKMGYYNYTLSIKSIDPFDFGEYLLIIPYKNKTIKFMRVLERPFEPQTPLDFRVDYCSAIAAHLYWTVGFPGKAESQSFPIKILENEESFSEVYLNVSSNYQEVINTSLTNLNENKTYSFNLQAVTQIEGKNYFSQASINTSCLTKVRPNISNVKIQLIATENQKYKAEIKFDIILEKEILTRLELLICKFNNDNFSQFEEESCRKFANNLCVRHIFGGFPRNLQNTTFGRKEEYNETLELGWKDNQNINATQVKACILAFDRNDVVFFRNVVDIIIGWFSFFSD